MSDDDMKIDHEALSRYLSVADRLYESAVTALFGQLPDWLPEPKRGDIFRAIALMEGAGVALDLIPMIVTRARAGEIGELPGAVREPVLAVTCAFELAHIRWALGMPKADALRELAGSRAARDYERSKRGNEAQHSQSAAARRSRDQGIRMAAANLKIRNASLTENAIAHRLAHQFDLSSKQIKRVLKAK